MIYKEKNRIKEFTKGELPHEGYLSFLVNTLHASEKLSLIKEVVTIISDYNESNWPSDEMWENLLPKWFLNKIEKYSPEEVIKNSSLLWDYGSWLDAMKYRGWEWYSSKINSNGFDIILIPITLPFSVNPLEYIIYETGVPIKNITFNDFSA